MFEIELDEAQVAWYRRNDARAREVLKSYAVDYGHSTMLPFPENVIPGPLASSGPLPLPYGCFARLNLFKQLVLEGSGLTEAELRAHRRDGRAIVARAVLFHFARRYTALSYPQLGRAVGRRDHCTVIWAIRRIERKPEQHQALMAYVRARVQLSEA